MRKQRLLETAGTTQASETPAGLELITLAGFPDHPFLIASSDRVIRNRVRAAGTWEPGLAQFAAELLPSAARVVIGGGHVGLLAFELWRARPDVQEIVVFEPDSVNAALLALNIASWEAAQVRSMAIALSDRTGTLTLARNPFNTGDTRLWEQIPEDLDAGGGDPRLWERQSVVGVALDDIWGDASLDLLVLDVQGWETEALRGAGNLFRVERPVVVFEWWPRALVARGIDIPGFLEWLRDDLQNDARSRAGGGVRILEPFDLRLHGERKHRADHRASARGPRSGRVRRAGRKPAETE